MKKVFLSFALLATVFSASAQQRNQFYLQTGTHSTNFGLAGQAPSHTGEQLANMFWGGLTGNLGLFLTVPPVATHVDTKPMSNVTFGFRHAVGTTQRLQVGVSTSVHNYSNVITWSEGPQTRTTERFVTGLADLQYTWLKTTYFDVYSGAGAGLSVYQQRGDHYRNRLYLNGQVNALGVQAHDGPIGAFVQVGVGAQGVVSGGLAVRF